MKDQSSQCTNEQLFLKYSLFIGNVCIQKHKYIETGLPDSIEHILSVDMMSVCE